MWICLLIHLFYILLQLGKIHGERSNALVDVGRIALNQVTNPFTHECKVAEKCPDDNIQFYLYTRGSEPYRLYIEQEDTIANANFVQGAAIKWIIHGYDGNKDSKHPNEVLRKAYFESDVEVNIIFVDYGFYAKVPCYIEAARSASVVADCSVQLIEKILEIRKEIQLHLFHLLGFSIGANIAGKMSSYLKEEKFDRITGLDTASPFFQFGIPFHQLVKTDALFVDLIHTNIQINGLAQPAGHVDFYANNAVFQPGCGIDPVCSHGKSAEFFAETIRYKEDPQGIGIWAAPCPQFLEFFCPKSKLEDLVLVGEYVNRSDRGIYFFITNAEEPYAVGKKPYHEYSKSSSFWPVSLIGGIIGI